MITIRPANARGTARFDWGSARHTFSSGDYLDREWHHFRTLRSIDEQIISPDLCTPIHEHRDLEVLTWVLEGTLHHHHGLDLDPATLDEGGAQLLRYGIGMSHQECNRGETAPCRLLRFGLIPARHGGPGLTEDRVFPTEGRRNRLQLLASPTPSDEAFTWGADAWIWATTLEVGHRVTVPIPEGRAAWVQVARGRVTLQGEGLLAGDGAALQGEPEVALTATQDSLAFVLVL